MVYSKYTKYEIYDIKEGKKYVFNKLEDELRRL
jgi:hypothetical protein